MRRRGRGGEDEQVDVERVVVALPNDLAQRPRPRSEVVASLQEGFAYRDRRAVRLPEHLPEVLEPTVVESGELCGVHQRRNLEIRDRARDAAAPTEAPRASAGRPRRYRQTTSM